MSRELFSESIKKSSAAIVGALLMGAALLLTSGCTSISGKPARAASPVRESADQRAALTGKWYKTEDGRIDYARYAGNERGFESYEITADGRVRAESLAASRSYDCPVEIASRREGTIGFVPGAPEELNISLDAGQTRTTNYCSAEKNSTAATAATSTNYRWRLAENADGSTALCLTPAGGGTTCYRRED